MEDSASTQSDDPISDLPTLALVGPWSWDQAISEGDALLSAIAQTLPRRRWFGAKSRMIRRLRIVDHLAVTTQSQSLLVDVEFTAGPNERYQLPLALATGHEADRLIAQQPDSLWARVEVPGDRSLSVIYDASANEPFCTALLRLVESQAAVAGGPGQVQARQAAAFELLRGGIDTPIVPHLLRSEQSNTSIKFGDRMILKLFRRLEAGLTPEIEISDFLARHGFAHVPPLGGWIEYQSPSQEPCALAMLQGYVSNQGDAWRYIADRLPATLLRSLAQVGSIRDAARESLYEAARQVIPDAVSDAFGDYASGAELLAAIGTGELHLALAADESTPEFAPEPFTLDDQRDFASRSLRSAGEILNMLQDQLPNLSLEVRALADRVLRQASELEARWLRFSAGPIDVAKIRCHGDYHLGQVLVTEGDFLIIDFEGEPARPLSERRRKQTALRDVAGIIRSYHYASCSAAVEAGRLSASADRQDIARLARAWYVWTCARFLSAYRRTVSNAAFVPRSDEQFAGLLDACLLEKAVYELGYELNNRPDWVYLPLEALCDLLDAALGSN